MFTESDLSDNIVLLNNATPINLINLICILLFIYLFIIIMKDKIYVMICPKGLHEHGTQSKESQLTILKSTDKI